MGAWWTSNLGDGDRGHAKDCWVEGHPTRVEGVIHLWSVRDTDIPSSVEHTHHLEEFGTFGVICCLQGHLHRLEPGLQR